MGFSRVAKFRLVIGDVLSHRHVDESECGVPVLLNYRDAHIKEILWDKLIGM
jgi:hypothetical protein